MFRDFDQSTLHDTSSVISAAHNKDYYKKNKISGIYKEYDPITGELIEEGQYRNGVEVGLWKVIDEDGDQQHFNYRQQRVGAVCRDGSLSSATGSGACSWHGGVSEWLYDNKKYQVGGTGKFQPIENKVKKAKNRLREEMKINILKSQQELFLQVANKLLKHNPNPQFQEKQIEQQVNLKIKTIKQEHQKQLKELQEIQESIEAQNLKLKEQNRKLQEKLKVNQKSHQKYEETIKNMKTQHDQQLKQKDREIQTLKKELQEANIREGKHKKKLDLSMSRSSNENHEIKNQIKLIQQQLALLNQTVESKQKNQLSYLDADRDVSDEEQENGIQDMIVYKKTLAVPNKQQPSKNTQSIQPSPQVQTNPKKTFQQPKESLLKSQAQLQSLNTSQQSSIHNEKNQQQSLSDSLSYSKILNSKLFKNQNNKIDLSTFVDFKQTKKTNIFTQKKDKNFEKPLQTSKNDQKRTYRFKPEEQSSNEEDQVTLRSDSDGDENYEIFKSIPFKPDTSEIKEKDKKTIKP